MPKPIGTAFVGIILLCMAELALMATASPTDLVPIYGPYPQEEPVAIDGKIYFGGHTAQAGSELWVADSNGSRQLVDLVPGPEGSYPDDFVKFRGDIYFSAKDNVFGRQLWRLSGAAAERVTTGKPGDTFAPQFPIVFSDAIYFRGRADDSAFAFWRFDGTNLSRIDSVWVYSKLIPFNGSIYFGGWSSTEHGTELYRSDGQTVSLAFEIAPGNEYSWPSMLGEYGGWLYFSACENGNPSGCSSDRFLFRTDGKTLEKAPGPKPAQNSPYLVALGKLYFWESEGSGTNRLCEFDGVNCRHIARVGAGDLAGPILISGSLYFVDHDPSGSNEQRKRLMRYQNGTSETIPPGDLKGWSLSYLVAANGFGFLRAWDSQVFRLWRIQP